MRNVTDNHTNSIFGTGRLLGAFLILMVISGCASGVVPKPFALSSNGETELKADETGPVAGDANGDGTLSGFEKQLLVQNARRDYLLSDGSAVSIDPTKPLADGVIGNIVSLGSEAALEYQRSYSMDENDAAMLRLMAFIDEQELLVGKPLVIVISKADQWGSLASSPGGTVADHWTGLEAKSTLDEMLRQLDSYATNRGKQIVVLS
jgi:hypothetical protein